MDFLKRGILAADWSDWVIALAYALAASICWQAARRGAGRERLFWIGCALVMVLLGINELFDFQTLATMIAKDIAKTSGWYDSRRSVQLIFVSLLAISALCSLAALGWLVRAMSKPVKIALVGLTLIGLFILLRAAIFHHLDEVVAIGPILTGAGAFAEIAGIALVAFAARATRVSSQGEGT